MFIIFGIYFLIFFQIIQSNQISNCSFLSSIYQTNSAVSKQIEFINQTSIRLLAHHAFFTPTISSLEFGLIYQYSQSNYLVPFPLFFSCTNKIYSCQLTTITTRDFEPIHVQLTSLNFTRFNQTMSLYLKQGRYQLSNCSINNQQEFTDLQTIFYIDIQYEKSVGSSCDFYDNHCGSSLLTTCSLSSSTCKCLSNSSSIVTYSNSFFCADMLNISNCELFPSRCITWCNQTTNYLCICPNNTFKIQRNNQFICELPINSNLCSINNSFLQCSIGQCCINQQCLDCSLTTIQSKLIKFYSIALNENLQWILSLVASVLGVSVIILISLLCWFNRCQHRNLSNKDQSISNTSTSSLYILPQQSIVPHSYRTDSFRHAVLSGKKINHILEHVSTRCDSEIDEKNRGSSPTFSTLEYIIPSQETNIYQIILPSNLTHTV